MMYFYPSIRQRYPKALIEYFYLIFCCAVMLTVILKVFLTNSMFWMNGKKARFTKQTKVISDHHSTKVKKNVMIWTQAEDVLYRVWSIVRSA